MSGSLMTSIRGSRGSPCKLMKYQHTHFRHYLHARVGELVTALDGGRCVDLWGVCGTNLVCEMLCTTD